MSCEDVRIAVELLNGETRVIKVWAKMTIREVKKQIKEHADAWEDRMGYETTIVELMVGDRKALNDETVEELGRC